MPVLTEQPTMGDVLKYEVNPNYTREVVTLLAGMPYPVGAVVGRITASGKYKLATSGGTDGAQTAAAVLLYAVDATLADAVGIVVARGPAIVSRAGLASGEQEAAKTAALRAFVTGVFVIGAQWARSLGTFQIPKSFNLVILDSSV